MKQLAVVGALSVVLALSASNAFGWGAVTGPRGGAAYRGPMGGAAVRGPYGGAVARGPAGGVAARGPYGGAAYRGPYGGTAVRGAYGGTASSGGARSGADVAHTWHVLSPSDARGGRNKPRWQRKSHLAPRLQHILHAERQDSQSASCELR